MRVLRGLGVFFASSTQLIKAATDPIVIKGYKMFGATSGKYFAVRGVDYYPRPNSGALDVNNHDFFTDDNYEIWKDHVQEFVTLNVNAIRLYAVDPSKSHDRFMCALDAVGIYVVVDLGASCVNCSISSSVAPSCYSPILKSRGEYIISTFAKYSNLLGFSAGNEVNHVVPNWTQNAPCQKKFIRDMRKFIKSCGPSMRPVPVGVVVADTNRISNLQYYNCRTDPSDSLESAEWYGLNVYLYCDGAYTDRALPQAGYLNLLSDLISIRPSIPVLLTEYGCLDRSFPTIDTFEAQRSWIQTAWLHSTSFREYLNGGFAFEFSTERANSKADSDYPFKSYGAQNYGLGYFAPDNCDHNGTACTYKRQPNFQNLANELKNVTSAQESNSASFNATSARSNPPSCPSGSPSLASFDWAQVENLASRACPASTPPFQCSATSFTQITKPVSTTDPTKSSAITAYSRYPSPILMGLAILYFFFL